MKLYFKHFGEGRPLLLLHGLLGSSDNWLSHAKAWAAHFQVYIIDQRNHGHSPHHPVHTYDELAQDLHELIEAEDIRHPYILGHSMGGKTAMRFAQIFPEFLQKLVVVDMGIKAYKPLHEEIFAGLMAADVQHCTSRNASEEKLKPFVAEESTRQFLLKNLYWKEPDQLAWRFNLEALYNQRLETTLALPHTVVNTPTLFLRGQRSNYITEEDYPDMR
ncbi:MAG: alpha/beta fold hydrolase, partial [Flavobacteriales bacterium]